MAIPISTTKSGQSRGCVRCGHAELEHGTTGTHPCLAVVGDLLYREFCSCNEFQATAAQAA